MPRPYRVRPYRASRLLGLVAATLVSAGAAAHDIVLLPEWSGGSLVVDVRYGHPDDWQPIVPDKLYRFEAIAADGSRRDWRPALALDAKDLRLSRAPDWSTDAGAALLAGEYDNGYWSTNGAGVMVNTSRAVQPKASVASHNLKYAKALVATGAAHAGFDRIVGQKLEIVPLVDPFALKVGDSLPVAVRFNGRPLVGAGVEIGDSVTAIAEDRIARYRTDASGIARVPIGKSGWEVVAVDHEEKSPTPRLADREKYTATLVFKLP